VRLIFARDAWDDYLYWQQHDRKIMRRLNDLIKSTMRTPFEGMGKPEPLKGDLAGYWSRRITLEHRLVYKPAADAILIVQCRYHY